MFILLHEPCFLRLWLSPYRWSVLHHLFYTYKWKIKIVTKILQVLTHGLWIAIQNLVLCFGSTCLLHNKILIFVGFDLICPKLEISNRSLHYRHLAALHSSCWSLLTKVPAAFYCMLLVAQNQQLIFPFSSLHPADYASLLLQKHHVK